ncbi:HisC Histidinol-phosphate/aromatic aminotransferase and cobyric acid decarboxylase [Candidatus Nanopelagicaceae bacterium]
MAWPSWLPLRDNLRPLSPYGAPQVPARAALNTNENPYSPSPALQKAITDAVAKVASDLNRYPDRDATVLRTKLADYINEQSGTKFSADNLWAANGSNEIIQSIFLAFAQGSVLGFTPSYSMHPLIAKVTGSSWIDGKRNADFSLNTADAVAEIQKHKPTLTFITTPNNPTGGAVAIDSIQMLADAAKSVGGLLVVDEAYAEFSQEISAVTLIANNPHVIVIRTMSKAFAFAGARVGYLVSDASVKDAMMIVRLPYHLSALTQAAAVVAIDQRAELLGGVSTLIAARTHVVQALHDMGLATIPSSANFVLFTGFKQDAPQLWAALLEKGVLIRDVGLSGYLRVTIGNEAENNLFISALKELI